MESTFSNSKVHPVPIHQSERVPSHSPTPTSLLLQNIMNRKRDRSYLSRHNAKRPRRTPSQSSHPHTPLDLDLDKDTTTTTTATIIDDKPTNRQNSAAILVVTGLPKGCSVLNLKSRFEMYGGVSRLRIDHGIGYITFRSKDSAEAAIVAASDPNLGITVDSRKVHVSWEDDSLPQWKKGIGFSSKERPSSKLVQPEQPLSKRGRGNKLSPESSSPITRLDSSFKGRDIIAYDDLF